MDEIIKINYDTEQPTVSARDLHEGLEIKTAFKDWFPRMVEYGFLEGRDFCSKMSESTGGRPAKDFDISVDMAKQICMIQRTDKGRQYRQYFLDLEKAWNTPDQVMARALKMAGKTIDSLKERCSFLGSQVIEKQKQIEEMQPKATYYDFFGIQFKQSGVWVLYREYDHFGYTSTKTHNYSDKDGKPHSKPHTYWTQKGRLFLYDFLKNKGIIPAIERVA